MIVKSFYRLRKRLEPYGAYRVIYNVYYYDKNELRKAGVIYEISLSKFNDKNELANEIIRVKHMTKAHALIFMWKTLNNPSLQQIKDLNNHLSFLLI